jgi:hypothetical protein
MKLYHFTARAYLSSIQESGIVRGDVPTSPNTGINAPWFTTDPSWKDQGWKAGSAHDKGEVRLTVEVPDHDPSLHHWPQYAKELGVEQWWYDALNKAAGNNAEHWYIYKGEVPVEWITDIEFSFDNDEVEDYDHKKLHKDTVQLYFELNSLAFDQAHQDNEDEAKRWTPIWTHLRNTNIIEITPLTLQVLTQRMLLDMALANDLDPFRRPKDEVEDALKPIIDRDTPKQQMPDKWPFECLYFGFGSGAPYQRHGTIALDRIPILHSIMITPNGDVWSFVGHMLESDPSDLSFAVHAERKDGKWMRPDTLTAWIVPWLIDYINEHQALVVDKTRSLSHKYVLKGLHRYYKHMPKAPPPYYVVPISMDDVRTEEQWEEGTGSSQVDWSHRWKRRGHERVKVRRGSLPLDPKTEVKLRKEWAGCKGDFELFTTGGLSIRAAKAMARRGIAFKRPDEWVAVLYTWIDEQVVLKDRLDLPFIPSVHAPVKQVG